MQVLAGRLFAATRRATLVCPYELAKLEHALIPGLMPPAKLNSSGNNFACQSPAYFYFPGSTVDIRHCRARLEPTAGAPVPCNSSHTTTTGHIAFLAFLSRPELTGRNFNAIRTVARL